MITKLGLTFTLLHRDIRILRTNHSRLRRITLHSHSHRILHHSRSTIRHSIQPRILTLSLHCHLGSMILLRRWSLGRYAHSREILRPSRYCILLLLSWSTESLREHLLLLRGVGERWSMLMLIERLCPGRNGRGRRRSVRVGRSECSVER